MKHFLIADRFSAKSKDIFAHRVPTAVFFGDSVTEGCFEIYKTGAESLDTVRDYSAVYHRKFAEKVFEKFPNVPLNVINSGISGDNATQATARIERDVLSYKPDLCVVDFGLNDCCSGRGGVAGYAASMRKIFTAIKSNGIDAVLLTPNMMCTRAEGFTDAYFIKTAQLIADLQNHGILDLYVNAAKEVAAELDVPVADAYARWKKIAEKGDVNALLANGINHPTRDMHGLFADLLFELVFG